MVMEYADGGELHDYVKSKKGTIEEAEVREFLRQIILGIQTCHKHGVIHRDLKLENVLFENKDRKRIKVVDFGISGMCKGN